MAASRVCEVVPCPAIPEYGKATCDVHRHYARAGELRIAKSPLTGRGGKACIVCNKTFVETDWVLKTMQRRPAVKRPGDLYGHQHAACAWKAALEPVAVEVPLFEELS